VELEFADSLESFNFSCRRDQDFSDLGSVTIKRENLQSLSATTFFQWITIFPHKDDDIFDGEIGEND